MSLKTAGRCMSRAVIRFQVKGASPPKQMLTSAGSVLLPCDFLSKFAFVLSVGELHGMTIDATSERSYDGNEGWGGERNRLVN